MVQDLIKSKEELEEIAHFLLDGIPKSSLDIVSRYMRATYDRVSFINGKKQSQTGSPTTVNQEEMGGIYTLTSIDDLFSHNRREILVARNLEPYQDFKLAQKGIKLPQEQIVLSADIPTGIERYDEELAEFSKKHPNTRLSRILTVEQRVIVNSQGGIFIQSIPFVGITYTHGYHPLTTSRDIAAVCTSEEDVKRLIELIAFLPDPTLDKSIKKSDSFSEAFHRLHSISALQYPSLEEAGISPANLYDVVVLTGTPVHEVFGHHFEEPIHFLGYNETPTFKHGQVIENKDLILMDNPHLTIADFKPVGFTITDAYGRRRPARIHIKDGKCMEFLGSEYGDPDKLNKYLNLGDTGENIHVGNAGQGIDGHFPQPRMSCTILDGKTEQIDLEGKIVVVSNEGHTSPQDKTYALGAAECYVIKDGKPMKVPPLRITGGVYQALANMRLLDDWTYNVGNCGKPAPQTRGMATVAVSEFTRSQVWENQQVLPLPLPDSYLAALLRK